MSMKALSAKLAQHATDLINSYLSGLVPVDLFSESDEDSNKITILTWLEEQFFITNLNFKETFSKSNTFSFLCMGKPMSVILGDRFASLVYEPNLATRAVAYEEFTIQYDQKTGRCGLTSAGEVKITQLVSQLFSSWFEEIIFPVCIDEEPCARSFHTQTFGKK